MTEEVLRRILTIVIVLLVLCAGSSGFVAGAEKGASPQIVRDIKTEGSCAVVGMTAEQCVLLALQRARSAAIERAAGVAVTSSTLVTNSALAVDFIKTYARGFVVKETVEWLPLSQYQKDSSTPPIPEYRVKLLSDVHVPEKGKASLGLKANLSASLFRRGERAVITIETRRKAKVAIFNITADDKVAMVFPNIHDGQNVIPGGEPFRYPSRQSTAELLMDTLKGHRTDAEAFFVVAADVDSPVDFMSLFSNSKPLGLAAFFKAFSEIDRYCDDTIVAYEVTGADD